MGRDLGMLDILYCGLNPSPDSSPFHNMDVMKELLLMIVRQLYAF